MPMPDGATTVTYDIRLTDYSNDAEEVAQLKATVSLANCYPEPTMRPTADAAVQAGADAIIAALDAAHPGGNVTATRSYDLTVTGDPWPATPQPLNDGT